MEFRDLKKQYQVLKNDIDAAMNEVCTNANFIGGRQVKELEEELAAYVGVKHCVTCANGTDALVLALMAWGIKEGDAVFVPDFTYFSSGEAVSNVGATPIFVDIDPITFNMDSSRLLEEVERVASIGELTPKAVIAVDLFGLPADYSAIRKVCAEHNLLLLEDGAQGFGGRITDSVTGNTKVACSFGDISTTSFFPAKPLGCYGDGGAIFTNNDVCAELLRSFAVHGKGNSKYDNVRIGMNSRLDTLQAAILKVKFKAFRDYELEDINKVASWYTEILDGMGIEHPIVPDGYYSSWAQYTIKLPGNIDRAEVQAKLKEAGISTMVYYVKPMHLQGAFAGTVSAEATCPVTEKLCNRVLSLPLHPYMSHEDVELVTSELEKCLK